jgi:C1A family cysteine protease
MSNREELNQGKKRETIDWKQKGLGWIPSYPDIRDYQLGDQNIQEKGTLKKDSNTDSIESLTTALIVTLEALNTLDYPKKDTIQKKLSEHVEVLQEKILGKIDFAAARAYKILRAGVDAPEEITKLKTCLSILMKYGCIGDRFQATIKEFLKWFSDKQFDETTQALVKEFQRKHLLESDGVVGLDTYDALSQALSDPREISQKQDSDRSSNNNHKAVLISVPSLIPEEIFEFIRYNLESIKFKQIQHYKTGPSENIEKYEGLREEFRTYLKTTLGEHEIEHVDLGKSNSVIKLDEFIEVFENEFSVVDPVVSLILQTITPVAQFDSFEDAMQKGIENFFRYLGLNDALLSRYLGFDHASQSTQQLENLDPNLRKLAIEAMTKARELAKQGKEQVVAEWQKAKKKLEVIIEQDDKKKIETEIRCCIVTLYFYFLLDLLEDGNLPSPPRSSQSSIFNKKEFFEIIPGSTDDSKGPTSEIFSFPELQVPVSKRLYTTRKWLDQSRPRKYILLPGAVDLSFWCSEIEDQEFLNSCTAFAGITLLEYFANRSLGKYTDVSPLFLYKTARNLMHYTGDTGASVRDTMKAMALFGVPPEKYWPYDEERVDEEPPSFCYSFAQNYQALKYFRLDYAGISKETLLFQIKVVLAAGFPCMFGFTTYMSAYEELNTTNGYFPFPCKNRDQVVRDKVVGGHAVVAVGYSDYKQLSNNDQPGALLIRNSWGPAWGQGGYGWLPYSYVLGGLTGDWWSMLKSEWFDEDHFGLGTPAWTSNVRTPRREEELEREDDERRTRR